jgi:hypothetical protein
VNKVNIKVYNGQEPHEDPKFFLTAAHINNIPLNLPVSQEQQAIVPQSNKVIEPKPKD